MCEMARLYKVLMAASGGLSRRCSPNWGLPSWFLDDIVATPFYKPTLLPQKWLEAPCLDNVTASTNECAYPRR